MKADDERICSAQTVKVGSKFSELSSQSDLTVFVGLFNGQEYLDNMLRQLLAQTTQRFPILVVDNFSSDKSWETILEWPEELKSRSKMIRNPINLGGLGSFRLNLSEIETDWIVTLHQDDVYLSNHIEVLSKSIKSAKSDDLVLFTDMGTLNESGTKENRTLVRQSWVANLANQSSSFLSNLSLQVVSYPSSAFRVSALEMQTIPWHSSSFPDTEITLQQASKGSFKFIPEQTMLYRMNPKSESNDLNPEERLLGPFASLCRVMASDSFMRLCLDVSDSDRDSFSIAILNGIETRLGESELSEIVKLIAAETMAAAWSYSEPNSRDKILEIYKVASDGRTIKLLNDLAGLYGQTGKSSELKSSYAMNSKTSEELKKLLAGGLPASNQKANPLFKVALSFLSLFLPLPLRRKVVGALIRFVSKLLPNSAWNLNWRPKN
jgi:hypothetical protein